MNVFRYYARDTQGRARRGEIDAPDEKAAVIALRTSGLLPIQVARKAPPNPLLTRVKNIRLFGGSEVVIFTRQLATMAAAGLPLTNAIEILRVQTEGQHLKEALTSIMRDIEGGSSFANALERHVDIFSGVYIALIRAGESAGVLDTVLLRLSENLEKDREFKAKTRGALVYPSIVIVAMMVVTSIMMIFVIPRLTGLYKELGTELPLPTKILIAVSEFTASWWYLVFAALFVLGFVLFRWAKTPSGRKVLDTLVLKIPIWGIIQKHVILAELSRTLSLLVAAGVPIIEALQIIARASGNVLYSDSILTAARQVERGFSLSQPLAHDPIFPPIVHQMIQTGESTGKLDEILMKLSLYFEGEAEHEIKGLTVAIEPIIMIILGVGVAFLVMSIILPIYKLTSSF